jgi:Pretoxin HINT domain
VFVNEDKQITTVIIKDQKTRKLETITTTPEHPFYAKRNNQLLETRKPSTSSFGWVNAGELKLGNVVWQGRNTTGIVARVKTVTKNQTMYNLEVEKAHTYFVGAGKWLVHNAARLWDPCGKKLLDKGSATGDVATSAERANIVLQELKKKNSGFKFSTVAFGRDPKGQLMLSICCDPKATRYVMDNLADFKALVGEDFRVLDDIFSARTQSLKDIPAFRENYHSERVQFNWGAEEIGISRQGGLCIPCQEVFNLDFFDGFLKDFPNFKIAVYARGQ